jgi:hypothetical protein
MEFHGVPRSSTEFTVLKTRNGLITQGSTEAEHTVLPLLLCCSAALREIVVAIFRDPLGLDAGWYG